MATTCLQCGRAFPAAELKKTPEGLACRECSPVESSGFPLPPLTIAAFVVAAIPLFANFSTSSSLTVNGEVVEAVSRDYVALGGGALGALLAIAALWAVRQKGSGQLLAAGGAIALAVFQLVRGFGMLG